MTPPEYKPRIMRRPVRYSRMQQQLVASQEARRRGQMFNLLVAYLLARFNREEGQDLVEYAMIVAAAENGAR